MDVKRLPTEELVRVAWLSGNLLYKLHSGQRDLYHAFKETKGNIAVICCSRRYGKSFLLCAMSIMECLSRPKAQVRYAAAYKRDVISIILPLFDMILEDCPASLKPTYHKQDMIWEFPNGSKIYIAGLDGGGAERLRGTSSDFIVVDEAGSVGSSSGQELIYAVESVLYPQLLTTNGKILLASTPSRFPIHAFNTKYVAQAKQRGELIKRTLLDAPHIPEKRKQQFIDDGGGANSPMVRREYFAEVVVDAQLAILPEFDNERIHIVEAVEPPEYRKTCTSIDFGFEDLTAVLFGYYDFGKDWVVIEDELEFQRQNSTIVTSGIRKKEHELWKKPADHRIGDTSPRHRADMITNYDFMVHAPYKVDKSAGVDELRMRLMTHSLKIHPRCKTLIDHCRGGVWRSDYSEFDRSSGMGHFDFIDALLYMCRYIDKTKPKKAPPRSTPDVWVDPSIERPVSLARRLLTPKWKYK